MESFEIGVLIFVERQQSHHETRVKHAITSRENVDDRHEHGGKHILEAVPISAVHHIDLRLACSLHNRPPHFIKCLNQARLRSKMVADHCSISSPGSLQDLAERDAMMPGMAESLFCGNPKRPCALRQIF